MTRRHDFTLWAILLVLGIHFLEEYALDFRGWFEFVLRLPVTWEQYHLVNVSVVLLAIACAAIGWRQPELALVMPAVLIVNAVFHIGASLIWWRYSPGAATSGLLFVPAALWAFAGARRDGVLTRRAVWWAAAGAVAYHLCLLGFFVVGPPGR
jgi:hypothetical protein